MADELMYRTTSWLVKQGIRFNKIISIEESVMERGCGEPICNCTYDATVTLIRFIDEHGYEDEYDYEAPLDKFLEMLFEE